MIEEDASVVLTGLIVTEVLQGLGRNLQNVESFLSHFSMLEPGGFGTYVHAALISQEGSARGISLHTVDTLVAAIALENHARLFTLDKDFARIASFTSLQLYPIP
jgi:predicted nucleic acid-binding protein